MSITIVPYNPQLKNIWNEVVGKSENSSFLFYRDFMEYHSNRFEDFSILVYDNDQPVGIFPANKKGEVLYSHQGLTYGGLMLLDRNKEKQILEYFYLLLKYYLENGISEIHYKVAPNYLTKSRNDFEHFVLNLLQAELTKVDTAYTIDYRNEISFQQRRKRSYKKGIKHNTEVIIDNKFDLFWNEILIPNLLKKHGTSPVHTLNEIKLLADKFPENIKQVNAYINKEIVAGVTLFYFDNTVHCQYISSNDFGRNSGAIDYLFYYLIDLYKDSATYFSLGTANNSGNDFNVGLGEWKSGWGAEIHANFHYKLKVDRLSALNKFIE